MLEYYIEKHFDEIIQITKPQIEKLIEKRKQIINFMNKNDLKFLPGETTFYIFASIADSKLNSEEFCSQLLQKYGVSVVPGIGYGDSCDNFIRISIGSENMKRVKTGLNFIRKLIKSTSF
jgi:aspartate aminotransferase/aminotransferase